MRVFLAVAAALTLAAPLAAQTAPAPAPAAATPKFTIDTPIETIAADPAGKAVLDKDLPGLTTHQMYDMFKTMSLKALQPMSQGKITDEGLVKVAEELAAIK